MLTTLTTRLITSPTLKYTYFNKKLTLIIEATAHLIYGDAKITIANAVDIDVYKPSQLLFEDIFNQTYLFKSVSANRLECSLDVDSGLVETLAEVAVANNGSAITTTVNNTTISTLTAGTYRFKLLDLAASVFDSALISIQELGITRANGVELDGVVELFDELGATVDYETIDGAELTFEGSPEISLSSIGASTNIPLLINKIS